MRLHRPPPPHNSSTPVPPNAANGSSRESGRLIFPRAALDDARRETRAVGSANASRNDVAGRIDRMLDRMQGQLDSLRQDADAEAEARFKFPTRLASTDSDGEWTPPSRAA